MGLFATSSFFCRRNDLAASASRQRAAPDWSEAGTVALGSAEDGDEKAAAAEQNELRHEREASLFVFGKMFSALEEDQERMFFSNMATSDHMGTPLPLWT